MSYNGAWWFVMTYLLLLVMSPVLAKLAKQVNGVVLLAVSLIIYFAAYLLRFNYVITFENPVLQWLWEQTVLLGTSQLGYFSGMACRKYGVIGVLRKNLKAQVILRRGTVILFPVAAFAGHCVIQSAFVAPFTAAGQTLYQHLVGAYVLLSFPVFWLRFFCEVSGTYFGIDAGGLLYGVHGNQLVVSAHTCVAGAQITCYWRSKNVPAQCDCARI